MKLLPQARYYKALQLLASVPFNTLFARAVLSGDVDGQVYADDPEVPSIYYVVHPYGMTLLLSDDVERNRQQAFLQGPLRDYLHERQQRSLPSQWMQIFPLAWADDIDRILVDRQHSSTLAKRHTRVNFRFEPRNFESADIHTRLSDLSIEPLSQYAYENFGDAVKPQPFWDSYKHFEQRGAGFEVTCEGKTVAVAFSAFVTEQELELGMEVSTDYRRCGLGGIVTGRLILECLHLGLSPIWSCNLANTGSYQLAQKLGFVPTLELPYYQLG